MELPLDASILQDALYANSNTMDARHFAEEFMRRKKLAEKGITEKSDHPISSGTPVPSNGGWNEVAKKGGKVDAVTAVAGGLGDFRVVPSKKGRGKK